MQSILFKEASTTSATLQLAISNWAYWNALAVSVREGRAEVVPKALRAQLVSSAMREAELYCAEIVAYWERTILDFVPPEPPPPGGSRGSR